MKATKKSAKSSRKATVKKSARALDVQHKIMSNAGHLAWATTFRNRLAKTRKPAERKMLRAKLATVLAHAKVSARLRQKVAA